MLETKRKLCVQGEALSVAYFPWWEDLHRWFMPGVANLEAFSLLSSWKSPSITLNQERIFLFFRLHQASLHLSVVHMKRWKQSTTKKALDTKSLMSCYLLMWIHVSLGQCLLCTLQLTVCSISLMNFPLINQCITNSLLCGKRSSQPHYLTKVSI